MNRSEDPFKNVVVLEKNCFFYYNQQIPGIAPPLPE